MANPYFRFKRFIVYHDLCAMKVGVDGVLLGAWAPVGDTEQRILDVGTGSGLIALMLAQRSVNADIDAIDIDEGAVMQARKNVSGSEWRDRIHVHRASFLDFLPETGGKYDLVVSNPPYFKNSLQTPDPSRTTARHVLSLGYEDMIRNAGAMLKKTGRICLILPVSEGSQCVKLAEQSGLYSYKQLYVHPKSGSPAKRLLLEFGLMPAAVPEIISHLDIETGERHCYSEEFTALAKDFYLKL